MFMLFKVDLRSIYSNSVYIVLSVDVLCCFVYYTGMDTIYSVEEIAAILKLQPFTVRKMFREKKLSGFKIGKAWRITESQLQAHITQLEESAQLSYQPEPSPADIPDKSQSPADREVPEAVPRAPFQNAGAPSYGSPLSMATGSLLIFSERPGEEVYLNGERQGPTTLSLLDLEAGEHRLQVGDVIDTITVLPDIETRVHSAGGVLNITTRSSVLTSAPTGEEIDAKLLVRMENDSELTGAMLVLLAGENAEATRRIFGDYPKGTKMATLQSAKALVPNESILEGKVRLSSALVRNESTVLFDGPITYVEGDRLEVTIPKQPGIVKQIRQTFPLTGDLSIKLSVGAGGMLRGRPTVRIKLEK